MYKVMVVDDERNIRRGIIQLIDWNHLNCEVVSDCRNGQDALDYLGKKPVDIVVTDIKMPSVDGIELSSRIKEHYPQTKVIILTAFSDFNYAKQAIKYGVIDFIIKNEFIHELPQSIEKAKAMIRPLASPEETVLECFKKLIRGHALSTDYAKRMDLIDYDYCILACDIDYYDPTKDKSHLLKILNNILTLTLKESPFHIIQSKKNYMIVVIQFHKSSSVTLNEVIQYANEIIIMVEEFMRIDIKLGISPIQKDYTQLALSHEQANTALSTILSEGSELNVYQEDSSDVPQGETIDIENYIRRINDLIFDNQQEESKGLLKELFDSLILNHYSFEQSKMYSLLLCSSIIRRAVKYQIDHDFQKMEIQVYQTIKTSQTMFSLLSLCDDTIDSIYRLTEGNLELKSDLVRKVDDYIHAHYKSDLTLQMISQELFLNNSYLSRAYKKCTGNTITKAINMYRINKAKSLLINTSKKIYEIAEDVGFNDAAYFTHVFYKYMDQSPSDFRQHNSL